MAASCSNEKAPLKYKDHDIFLYDEKESIQRKINIVENPNYNSSSGFSEYTYKDKVRLLSGNEISIESSITMRFNKNKELVGSKIVYYTENETINISIKKLLEIVETEIEGVTELYYKDPNNECWNGGLYCRKVDVDSTNGIKIIYDLYLTP